MAKTPKSEAPAGVPPDHDMDLCFPIKLGLHLSQLPPTHPCAFIDLRGTHLEGASNEKLLTWHKNNERRTAYSLAPLLWRAREAHTSRTRLVWTKEPWWNSADAQAIHLDHFPHASQTPGLIAFTPSILHGVLDRQTAITPGKYLTRYFKDFLSPKQIIELSEWQISGTKSSSYSNSKAFQLKFASTREEIEFVYKHGPSSCMSDGKLAQQSNSKIPPESTYEKTVAVAAYAAGDLSIAYLQSTSDPTKIPARAITFPAKQLYGRVYPSRDSYNESQFSCGEDAGNAQAALISALRNLGFSTESYSNRFTGAKLLRIPFNEEFQTYVVPYLDSSAYVQDEGGEFLTWISSEDSSEAEKDVKNNPQVSWPAHGSNISGTIRFRPGDAEIHCNQCAMWFQSSKNQKSTIVYSYINEENRPTSPERYCEACLANSDTWYCDGFGQYFTYDIPQILVKGRAYSKTWFRQHAFISDYSGEAFLTTQQGSTKLTYPNQKWSAGEFAQFGFVCAVSGLKASNQYADPAKPTQLNPELLNAYKKRLKKIDREEKFSQQKSANETWISVNEGVNGRGVWGHVFSQVAAAAQAAAQNQAAQLAMPSAVGIGQLQNALNTPYWGSISPFVRAHEAEQPARPTQPSQLPTTEEPST